MIVQLPYAFWPRWKLTQAVYSMDPAVRAAAAAERRRRQQDRR